MLFLAPPSDFDPKMTVVSCFIEHKGEFLLLQRQSDKIEGAKWGVPAGKVDPGESLESAILREVFEETGIKLISAELAYFNQVFVRYPEFDFIYHMFSVRLKAKTDVTIAEREHMAFLWSTPINALTLPLIRDEDECIRLFYQLSA